MIFEGSQVKEQDRTGDFEKYAKRVSKGEILTSPTLLSKEQRRLYIRNTLKEDHTHRVKNKPEEATQKFDKIASSLYKFFRGTSLLFYRDYAGTDSYLPLVFTIGDVHPENFGVMPNENNVPFFGVNDFDEAYYAPFSYDIKRGAVGFYIVCKVRGFKKKSCEKIVKSFVKGYLEGLKSFAKDDRERWHQFRLDNSPKLIKDLIKKSQKSREEFLTEKLDMDKERFRTSDETVPFSKHIEEFQQVIKQYVEDNQIEVNGNKEDFFKVKDVAVKKGSGTASMGLNRYWILINGPTEDKDDNLVLEMKQARNSALTGLVGAGEKTTKNTNKAAHIVDAHKIHLAGGDRFYGYATYNEHNYLIRERSPFKEEIDLDDLNKSQMKEYASICGQTLAQTHARSDKDAGIKSKKDAEVAILEAININLFVNDMKCFAKEAARRIEKDYMLFKKDHKQGAFDFRR